MNKPYSLAPTASMNYVTLCAFLWFIRLFHTVCDVFTHIMFVFHSEYFIYLYWGMQKEKRLFFTCVLVQGNTENICYRFCTWTVHILYSQRWPKKYYACDVDVICGILVTKNSSTGITAKVLCFAHVDIATWLRQRDSRNNLRNHFWLLQLHDCVCFPTIAERSQNLTVHHLLSIVQG